jgi:hypothetical protein
LLCSTGWIENAAATRRWEVIGALLNLFGTVVVPMSLDTLEAARSTGLA